jgi:hypothetical protein
LSLLHTPPRGVGYGDYSYLVENCQLEDFPKEMARPTK